jgi:hypothetical protein
MLYFFEKNNLEILRLKKDSSRITYVQSLGILRIFTKKNTQLKYQTHTKK